MFHIVIEPIKREMSELRSDEDNDYTEVFRAPLDSKCVQFSVGNPRVEHITGIVHLYKRNTPLYGSAGTAQESGTSVQVSSASGRVAPGSRDLQPNPQRTCYCFCVHAMHNHAVQYTCCWYSLLFAVHMAQL